MSENKTTVSEYMNGFERGDRELILACLHENVEWEIPGFVHVHGKEAFAEHIQEDEFEGTPRIEVTRMTEEDNVVIAEGTVSSSRKKGEPLRARFCDVFEMRLTKISKLTSYLVQLQ